MHRASSIFGCTCRFRLAMIPLFCATGLCGNDLIAAELKPQSVTAWDDYVRAADARMRDRLQPGHPFLWIEEDPERVRQVRAGAILVAPVARHMPIEVPSGLLHDWIGAAFLPGATLDDVFCVLRDYSNYAKYYAPHVVESKLIRQDAFRDQYSLIVMNRAFLTKTALDGDYSTSYFRVDDQRRYSILRAINLQEIRNYKEPDQRKLPVGQGTGYIWNVHAITRMEQCDGGVYLEVEAIALSRDIPAALHWLVDPIVRRVARNSVTISLSQTRAAVAAMENDLVSHVPAATRSALRPVSGN